MNALTRIPPATSAPPIGTRQGNWTWDGTTWVCGQPDCGPAPPCPPPGWPPPGCPPWWSGANSPPWYPGANAGVSFGTTAPPNPVRGHFWWDGTTLWIFDGAAWEIVGGGGGSSGGGATISSTAPTSPTAGQLWWNGTVLQLWDGTAWKSIGPGASPAPFPTSTFVFGIAIPNPISIPAGAWTIVPFNAAPSLDTLQGWDPATNKYTPNKAGIYQFNIRTNTGAATGTFGIALLKNDSGSITGASDTMMAIQELSGTAGEWMTSSGVAQMNGTTDFVRMFGFASTASLQGAGSDTVFSALALP